MNIFKKRKPDIAGRRLAGRDESKMASSGIFKRNRTLTGTTSNYLDSANIKSDLESPRVHAHNLAIKRRKILSILLIVFASIAVLWLLIINFTAKVIVGVSNSNISKSIEYSNYESAIQEYLNIYPMSRLNFFLNQSSLSTFVSGKLPEVATVAQQNRAGFGETNFAITLRQPVAGWVIDNKQYFVDSKGISFEQNYFSMPTVQIVDKSGASIQSQTGTAIVSKRFLSFVGQVVSLIKTNGYTVTEAVLPIDTTRELEARLENVSYSIKMSIDRSAGEQVEDIVRAVQYFTSVGQTPSYIDVRVSGKAFYK